MTHKELLEKITLLEFGVLQAVECEIGAIVEAKNAEIASLRAEIDRLNAELLDADDTIDLMMGEPCPGCERIDRLEEQLTGAGIMIDVKQAEIEQLKAKLSQTSG